MTEGTQPGRSVRTSSRLSRAFATPGRRFLSVVAGLAVIAAVAIGSYVIGRGAGDRETKTANSKLQFAQNEYDKLSGENNRYLATITDLQGKLKKSRALLSEIMPSENTYNVNPNQSIIAADGHLTIGLVGSPSNEGIKVNINGTMHSVAAGDVIHVTLDSSTSCQVGVQSFDMFKAVLSASCAAAKPH